MIDSINYISIDKIRSNPFQPRESFDKEKIEELAESIKEEGLLEPIIVRKKGKTYEIIAGERRWKAYQFAGQKEIPAIIKDVDDFEAREISLVENWHRVDLEPNEKEKFIFDLWHDGQKKGRYKSINNMSEKTAIPYTTLSGLIYAHEEREEILSTKKNDLSYSDFYEVRSIKGDKEIWTGLLERRGEGKIKSDDLRKTTKVLKEAPKIKESVKTGYTSLDEVIKLSSKGLEPTEVEEKIMEKELVISKVDTGKVIICPVCNKKLKLMHKDPEGHKIVELEEE
jgi:ParB/RepB/Spo0J family partition protein